MKVYKINFKDENYRDYYVAASSFNEAEKKICLQKMKEKEEKKISIFDSDGSLRPEVTQNAKDEPIVVQKIEMLTDDIIL